MASADAAGVVYGFYVASLPDESSTRARPHPVTSTTSVAQQPPPPSGTASGAVLGIYDGNHSSASIEATADWLGSPHDVQYAMDFIDDTSWSTISDPSWFISQWQGTPYTMVWGVPMVPCGAPSTQCSPNASEFDAVASGADNSYYTTLAQNLVAGGFGSSYIRLGWEFQGGWFPWNICNSDGQADFVNAFRNIVTSMRSVSANFKFIWNPDDSADTSCAGQVEDYYPGDNYVNMVALDVYDMNGAVDSDSARWTDMLNGVNAGGWTATRPESINGQSFEGYGLNWLAAFGHEHGKEIGLPEWGLWSSSSDGGGDDPYFVNQMASWIKTNATGPSIFWNYDSGSTETVLTVPNQVTGGVPDASDAFRTDFEGY
jgi:Glycosyl hydrolase family 26